MESRAAATNSSFIMIASRTSFRLPEKLEKSKKVSSKKIFALQKPDPDLPIRTLAMRSSLQDPFGLQARSLR
jgi:hypothetical protein